MADALESVLDKEGEDRARYLMTRAGANSRPAAASNTFYAITTPYRNTIPTTKHAWRPVHERRIRSLAVERHGDGTHES